MLAEKPVIAFVMPPVFRWEIAALMRRLFAPPLRRNATATTSLDFPIEVEGGDNGGDKWRW